MTADSQGTAGYAEALQQEILHERLHGRRVAAERHVAEQNKLDIKLTARSGHYLRRGSGSAEPIRYGPARQSICSKFIIDPEDNTALKCWDGFSGALLFYVCFATPLEVAFMDVETDGLFVVNLVIDVMFLFDMILQFFLPFQQMTKSGQLLIYDHRRIVRHYMKSWFIVDFVSIFPFDLVALLFSEKDDGGSAQVQRLKILQTIRLFRLVKLIRLLKGLRLIHRYQTHVAISYRKTTLMQLFLTLVIAGHWLGCVLGLLMRMQGESCVFDEPDPCVDTWASKAMELSRSGLKGEVEMIDYYLVSLHTSFTILVHPHKQTPRSREEFLVFTLLLLCGGFIWARLIGKSTVMFTSLDRHHIFFRQTMDDLNLIIAEKGISPGLRHKLREFFMNTQDMSQREMWADIVKRMSPQLQREVARETNKHLVLQITFLSRLYTDMATEVCMQLTKLVFSKGDTFGEAYQLYAVSLGSLQRREIFGGAGSRKGPEGGWKKTLGKGGHWGEEHLLLTNPDLLSDNRAKCVNYCEVMTLSAEDFANIAEDHPDCHAMLRRYYVRCAVFYGFLMQADNLLQKRGLPTRFFMPHPRTYQVEKRHNVLKQYGAACRGFVPHSEKGRKLQDPCSDPCSSRSVVGGGESRNRFPSKGMSDSSASAAPFRSPACGVRSHHNHGAAGKHAENWRGKNVETWRATSSMASRPQAPQAVEEVNFYARSPFRRQPQNTDDHKISSDGPMENGHTGNGERMIPASCAEIPDSTKHELVEVSSFVKAHCRNLDKQLSLLHREARSQCDDLTMGMSALIKLMTESRESHEQQGQEARSSRDNEHDAEEILAEHAGVGATIAQSSHDSQPSESLTQPRTEAPD